MKGFTMTKTFRPERLLFRNVPVVSVRSGRRRLRSIVLVLPRRDAGWTAAALVAPYPRVSSTALDVPDIDTFSRP